MSTPMCIRSEFIGDVLILELRDTVANLPDHAIVRDFEDVRQKRKDRGASKIIFDLAGAHFFGSILLELIRVLWNDMSSTGGKLVLCNPSAFGREVLQIAKFDQLWPIVENRQEGLDLLGPNQNVALWPQPLKDAIALYDRGPLQLREAVDGLSQSQLRTPAPPGAWSVQQIVCHIADFELVYADRMKRIVAEDQPTMFGGDPDVFAAKLAYLERDVDDELNVIDAVRRQVSRFLKTLSPADFERTGKHSVDGPLSLATLLQRIAGHIPHHVEFIEGKRKSLAEQPSA